MKRNRFKNVNPRPHKWVVRKNAQVQAHAKVVTDGGGEYMCSNYLNVGGVLFKAPGTGMLFVVNEKLLTVENVKAHITKASEWDMRPIA